MPTYGPLTLNKHRNIGQLTYEQVDSNWDELEETVNEIGGDLSFQFPNDNLIATSDPTVNDDSSAGYSKFSRWYNSTNQTLWALTDPTVGAAVWVDTGWEYFQLGSASIAQIGTGPAEVPTNNMLGENAYLNLATTADVVAGISTNPIGADVLYLANAPVVSSELGALTPDFASARVLSITVTGNATLENPTGALAGMSGKIILTMDSTGGYTFAIAGTSYQFVGGEPVIPTTANAKSVLNYYCESPTAILLSYEGEIA